MPVNSFENYPMSWKPELEKEKGLLSSSVGRGIYVAYDVATQISAQVPTKEENPIELEPQVGLFL